MRQPIIKRKKLSFMGLVRELEKFKPRFGKDVTVCVKVEHWNHSHVNNTDIEYRASFKVGSFILFRSKSPTDLIYQVEKHLANKESVINENIQDVLI